MVINKAGQYKLADKESAEMFWECLRRRDDYRDLYIAYQRTKDANCKSCDLKQWIIAREQARLNWGNIHIIRYPINPDTPFSKIAPVDKCVTIFINRSATIYSTQLSPKARFQLATIFEDMGYSLPDNFTLKLIHEKITTARKRADIQQFRKEMRAWDMRKKRNTLYVIGDTLGLFPEGARHQISDAAKNYVKAARNKIRCCIDWRVNKTSRLTTSD